MLNEGNQIHNFISSSCSGTVINYGSGSDFLTSYGSGSGSTSQKATSYGSCSGSGSTTLQLWDFRLGRPCPAAAREYIFSSFFPGNNLIQLPDKDLFSFCQMPKEWPIYPMPVYFCFVFFSLLLQFVGSLYVTIQSDPDPDVNGLGEGCELWPMRPKARGWSNKAVQH